MSKVVAFRDKIIGSVRTSIPEFRQVDWYDGMFDEKDVAEWGLKTPCAMVALMSTTNAQHHSTMELNLDLRCLVVIIANDRGPRDADAIVWGFGERIMTLANFNKFGEPDAAAATALKLKRLVHPDLRHEGVAIAVVEWSTGLMIGRNRVLERDFIYNEGVMVTKVPNTLTADTTVHDATGASSPDTITFDTTNPEV